MNPRSYPKKSFFKCSSLFNQIIEPDKFDTILGRYLQRFRRNLSYIKKFVISIVVAVSIGHIYDTCGIQYQSDRLRPVTEMIKVVVSACVSCHYRLDWNVCMDDIGCRVTGAIHICTKLYCVLCIYQLCIIIKDGQAL